MSIYLRTVHQKLQRLAILLSLFNSYCNARYEVRSKKSYLCALWNPLMGAFYNVAKGYCIHKMNFIVYSEYALYDISKYCCCIFWSSQFLLHEFFSSPSLWKSSRNICTVTLTVSHVDTLNSENFHQVWNVWSISLAGKWRFSWWVLFISFSLISTAFHFVILLDMRQVQICDEHRFPFTIAAPFPLLSSFQL